MKITIDTEKKTIEYAGNLADLFDYVETHLPDWQDYDIICPQAKKDFGDSLLNPTAPTGSSIWIIPPRPIPPGYPDISNRMGNNINQV